MLTDSNLMAFVATTNAARARDFYGGTLGLKFIAKEPTALVFNANGTMLRISLVDKLQPQPFTVLGWEVDDIGEYLVQLRTRRVTFEQYGFPGQDEHGIWHIPDGTQVAWFKDPEGNLLSITQFAK